jgi:hypothetical protein
LLKVALSVKQTLNTVSVAAKIRWPIPFIIVYVYYILMNLFSSFQLYRDGQFYWWMKLVHPGKPPTCRNSLTIFIT